MSLCPLISLCDQCNGWIAGVRCAWCYSNTTDVGKTYPRCKQRTHSTGTCISVSMHRCNGTLMPDECPPSGSPPWLIVLLCLSGALSVIVLHLLKSLTSRLLLAFLKH
eukprot:Blabericola_migrator_1__8213@NODE_424_length_8630_cov_20_263342_g335_i0_p4_GENE_NODE_424_length_8630_cov_20_263342_g335_i0NODE_424_length_8630_cov_20_263342_g335_i0_p4_ORF_typecomplete_len108_score2_57PSI_integrin/PF17205_3/0_4PSI_integrin/PF17205_3/9_5e02_NODE_424_length_8630_cov_20_263342_g335_i024742797